MAGTVVGTSSLEPQQERRATLAKTAGMADLEELIEFGSVTVRQLAHRLVITAATARDSPFLCVCSASPSLSSRWQSRPDKELPPIFDDERDSFVWRRARSASTKMTASRSSTHSRPAPSKLRCAASLAAPGSAPHVGRSLDCSPRHVAGLCDRAAPGSRTTSWCRATQTSSC